MTTKKNRKLESLTGYTTITNKEVICGGDDPEPKGSTGNGQGSGAPPPIS